MNNLFHNPAALLMVAFTAIAFFACSTPAIFGMINQVYTGTPTSRRFALCPSTIIAGQPVLLGKIPAIALDDYSDLTGGTTFLLGGSFSLSVTAKSSLSPSTGATVKPGDKIYADGGTVDATTNVTYGFTLDVNSGSGVFFGELDPSSGNITSATTNAAATVILPGGGN